MTKTKIKLIPKEDIVDEDTRNSKFRYLENDSICIRCGVIINSYYNDDCIICENNQQHEFISGIIQIQIRTLLNMHLEELRIICQSYDITSNSCSRPQMVIRILQKLNKSDQSDYADHIQHNIDEKLIRKIILRNKKKFFYTRQIDDYITRVRRRIIRKPTKIKLY